MARIKRTTAKKIVTITNILLTLFIVSMVTPGGVQAEEYFCKVYSKDILNYDGDGEIDTMIYTVGCTKIRPGQMIVRMNIEEVEDRKLRGLFEDESDPLGIRED